MINLYLTRHGETEENVAKILQGHLPGHLSKDGHRQATELAEKITRLHPAPQHLIASDLLRARETTRLANVRTKLPVTFTSLLRERDWGSLTGLPVLEARRNPLPPDVESVQAMHLRARSFLQFLTENFDGETVLAIGHGLFNRCILATLTGCTIQDIPQMMNTETRHICLDGLQIWETYTGRQEIEVNN